MALKSCCGGCFGKLKKKGTQDDDVTDVSSSEDDAYGFVTLSKRGSRGGNGEILTPPDADPCSDCVTAVTSHSYHALPGNNNKGDKSRRDGPDELNFASPSNKTSSPDDPATTPLSVKDRIRCFESQSNTPTSPPSRSSEGKGQGSEVKLRDGDLEGFKPKKKKPMSKAFEDFESTGILIGFGNPLKKPSNDDDQPYSSEFAGFPDRPPQNGDVTNFSDNHEVAGDVFSSPDHVMEEDGVGSVGSMEYRLPALTQSQESDRSISLSSGSKLTEDEGIHTMDSEDDDFSVAVPRQTELLKHYRRAPPPKNRNKARRSMGKGRRSQQPLEDRLLNGSGVQEEDEAELQREHYESHAHDLSITETISFSTNQAKRSSTNENDRSSTKENDLDNKAEIAKHMSSTPVSKTHTQPSFNDSYGFGIIREKSKAQSQRNDIRAGNVEGKLHDTPNTARPASFNAENREESPSKTSLKHAHSLRSWRENLSKKDTVDGSNTTFESPPSWRERQQSSLDTPSGYESGSPGFKTSFLDTSAKDKTPSTTNNKHHVSNKSISLTTNKAVNKTNDTPSAKPHTSQVTPSTSQMTPLTSQMTSSSSVWRSRQTSRKSNDSSESDSSKPASSSSWRPRHTEVKQYGATSSQTTSKWSSQRSSESLDRKTGSAPFKYEKYLINPSEATRSFSDFGRTSNVPYTPSDKSDKDGSNKAETSFRKSDTFETDPKPEVKKERDIMSTSLPSTAFDVSKYLVTTDFENFGADNGSSSTNNGNPIRSGANRPQSYHHDNGGRLSSASSMRSRDSANSRYSSYAAEATFTNDDGSYSFYTPNPLGVTLSNATDSSESKPDVMPRTEFPEDNPSTTDNFEAEKGSCIKEKGSDDLAEGLYRAKEVMIKPAYHQVPARKTSPPNPETDACDKFKQLLSITSDIYKPADFSQVLTTKIRPMFLVLEDVSSPISANAFSSCEVLVRLSGFFTNTSTTKPVHDVEHATYHPPPAKHLPTTYQQPDNHLSSAYQPSYQKSSSDSHYAPVSGFTGFHAPVYGVARHDPTITDSNTSRSFSLRKQNFESGDEPPLPPKTYIQRSQSSVTHGSTCYPAPTHTNTRPSAPTNTNTRPSAPTSTRPPGPTNTHTRQRVMPPEFMNRTQSFTIAEDNGNTSYLDNRCSTAHTDAHRGVRNLNVSLHQHSNREESANGNYEDEHEAETDVFNYFSSATMEPLNTSQEDLRDHIRRSSSGSSIKFNVDFSATTV